MRSHFTTILWSLAVGMIALPLGSSRAQNANPLPSTGSKSVLVLYGERGDLPANRAIEENIRAVFHKFREPHVELYSEYCDFTRFPAERHAAPFLEYLKTRYEGRKIDLIIPVAGSALEFILQTRQVVFPGASIVFCGIDQRELQRLKPPADVTGMIGQFDIEGTLNFIRRMQPSASELLVVNGVAGFDERWGLETRAAIEKHPRWRARARWLDFPSLQETAEYLRTVPRSSAVLFVSMLRDRSGQTMSGRDAVRDLAAASNAPVYGMSTHFLEAGIVGGALYDFGANGRATAELAVRALRGVWTPYDVTAIPPSNPVMVNWRALERWGLPPSAVPANAIVRFQPPSLWQEHRAAMIASVIVFTTQGAWIIALLRNRRRRRRSEEALRESEERMSLAAEAASLGFWAWDLASNSVWTTEKCRSLLECGPAEANTYQSLLRNLHPEDRAATEQAAQDALRTGKGFYCEYRVCTGSTADRWISARGRVHSDPSGNPVQMLGVCIDITAQKEAAEMVRRSESRLSSAVQVAALGLYERRDGTNMVYLDERARVMLGISEEDTSTEMSFLSDRIHPDDRPRVDDLQQRLADGAAAQVAAEYRYRHPQGGLIWISEVAHVVPQETSGPTKLQIGVFQDITARKRAEYEMERQRMELAHASRVSTLGQLASSLAHELNQPLGAILRNAEAAEMFLNQANPDLDEIRAILADIRKDDLRAGEVIERMRALLKRRTLDLQPLSLATLTSEVITMARMDAIARHVVIETDIPDDLPLVCADRIHLQQVLLNLIINGMDALTEADRTLRRISVSAQAINGSRVRLSVADTGHGIDPQRMEELFQPFFTTKTNGMGIGLSISRTIIEAHQGEIWAENNSGRGATFHIKLPVVPSGVAL